MPATSLCGEGTALAWLVLRDLILLPPPQTTIHAGSKADQGGRALV